MSAVEFDARELPSRLEEARESIGDVRVELLLERGDRRGMGWVGRDHAVIAHPLPGGRARLVTVPAPLMVDALVRMNDVGPRRRAEPAPRIAVAPGELAQALAARDPGRARVAGAGRARAFAGLIEGLREHWRVATRWEPAAGRLGGRELEVLDTDGGYWIVVPDEPTVELWPSTPTAVLAGLCRVFPLATEMRAWTPR